MTTTKIIAFGINSLIILVTVAVGFRYLIATEITTYHQQIIGVEWQSLSPGIQTLLLTLMKGTGDALIVCGVSMAILLWIPFRRGENWSRWALLIVGLSCLIPMLGGSIYLALTTGASSPWWLNSIITVLMLLAFVLSAEGK